MHLKLEKQPIVKLSTKEMACITGGGKPRSDRRTGRCAYSDRNGVMVEKNNEGRYVGTGCYPG
ncbi:MAG: hypothetical protein ACFB10_20755 [Salibacteraceae bacterium]